MLGLWTAATLVVAACGGDADYSADTTAPPNGNQITSGSASSNTVRSSAWQFERNLHVVTIEGWEYDVWLGWDYAASFEKDISGSPPGLARWTSNVVGDYSLEFEDTLAGRTAPGFFMSGLRLVAGYRVPKELGRMDLHPTDTCSQGGITYASDAISVTDTEVAFTCKVVAGTYAVSIKDNEEAHIDELLAALAGRGPDAFVVSFNWEGHAGGSCEVALPIDPAQPAYNTGVSGPDGQCTVTDIR